jgi:[acyl-carrier-protein] S-malonyltransferase
MQSIAQRLDGGMAAVKRMNADRINDLIVEANGSIHIANYNSPDQIVVSGPRVELAAFASTVMAAGGELVPLTVAGPWHHPNMQAAADEFGAVVDETHFFAPRCPIYMNVSGNREADPVRIKQLVRAQMTSPVFWQLGVEAMFAAGATLFLEVGPGKVLRGLMRRIIAEESAYQVRSIEGPRSLQFVKEALRTC